MRALAEGNALYENPPLSPNPRAAIASLEGLVEDDPQNAAYSLLLAHFQDQVGTPPEQLASTMERALNSQRYDTHIRALFQRIYERGLSSIENSVVAAHLISRFPTIDYSHPHSLVKLFVGQGDPALDAAAMRLGRLLMKEGNEQGFRRETVYWSATEYNLGLNLFQRGWKETHPDEELTAEARDGYGKFFTESPATQARYAIWAQAADQNAACPVDAMTADYAREYEDFLQYQQAQAERD